MLSALKQVLFPPPLTAKTLQAQILAEPEKNTCVHRYVSGSFTNVWVPTIRWIVFGVTGLVFMFGFVRSANVWRQRKA